MKISGLTITTAVAIYAAASPAKALTLTMACEGYNVVFSPGSLMSHAPKKDRDYPITKVDVQNDRIVVTGVTKYGKLTAFFSNDGHSSIVWTNGKDVVLNQCASDVAAAPPSIGTVVATTPPKAIQQENARLLQENNTRLRDENTRLQQENTTIAKLSSSSSGKGALVVTIGPKITIGTTNNEFSDSINHTLLSPSSNVFQQVVSLSKDQQIVFSGSFLPGDTDCVQETSLTQEGSMTDPEFQFLFTDVRAP